MPIRALIAPGFVLVGVGLLMMRGLTAASDWTHLLPGMIVAGIGAGLINVPLASTAVGVVEPRRAGMASGINSTFRQVGIATGVAALGAVFTSDLRTSITAGLAGTPLAGHAQQIAHAATGGRAAGVISSAPPAVRGLLAHTVQAGFVDGLNVILLVGAIVAFAAAVPTFVLIRQRDFVVAPDAQSDDGESVAPAVSVG